MTPKSWSSKWLVWSLGRKDIKIDDDKEWEKRRKVCRQVKKVLTPSSTLFSLPAVNVVICNVSQLIICNLRSIFIDMNVCRKPAR